MLVLSRNYQNCSNSINKEKATYSEDHSHRISVCVRWHAQVVTFFDNDETEQKYAGAVVEGSEAHGLAL